MPNHMQLIGASIAARAAGDDEAADALADMLSDLAADATPFDGLGEPDSDSEARNRQRMLDAIAGKRATAEACVPNKSGKGYHDDKTGHPCTPTARSASGRKGAAKPTARAGGASGQEPIRNPVGKSYAGVKAEVKAVWDSLEPQSGTHSVERASRNIGRVAEAVRAKKITQDDGLELCVAQILGGELRGGNYPVDSETVVNTKAGKVVVGVDAKNTRAVDGKGGYKADQITIKPDASENKAHWARQRAIDGRPGLALAFRFDPTQSYSVVVAATVRTASIGSGGELNKLGEQAVATIPLCGEEARKPCVSGLRDLGKPEVIRAVRAAIKKVAEEQDFGEWSKYLRSEGDRKRAKAADVVNSGMSDAEKVKALMRLLNEGWDPNKHPRASDGKFGSGSGSTGAGKVDASDTPQQGEKELRSWVSSGGGSIGKVKLGDLSSGNLPPGIGHLYKQTQAKFAEDGTTHRDLIRGMAMKQDRLIQMLREGGADLSNAAAWTEDKSAAKEFIGLNMGSGKFSVYLYADALPVDRIIAAHDTSDVFADEADDEGFNFSENESIACVGKAKIKAVFVNGEQIGDVDEFIEGIENGDISDDDSIGIDLSHDQDEIEESVSRTSPLGCFVKLWRAK